MKTIAIIPARSGSKGLKDKNIRCLNGKPLMAYSIEAALETGMFQRVHVSTDSKDYAEIARAYHADVPFLRSDILSSDTASTWDVVKEVLEQYSVRGEFFDECVLLQPTSPLRDGTDIIDAYHFYKMKKADSVVSVCAVEHSIDLCFKLDDTYSMNDFIKNPNRLKRRQELPIYYRENGAIYIFKTKDIYRENFDFYQDECYAYVMDQRKSIDIDEEVDFKLAEVFLKYYK